MSEDVLDPRLLGAGQHTPSLVWFAYGLASSPVFKLGECGLALSLPVGPFSSHCHREGNLGSQRKALSQGHAAESRQRGFKVRDAQFQEETPGLSLRNFFMMANFSFRRKTRHGVLALLMIRRARC